MRRIGVSMPSTTPPPRHTESRWQFIQSEDSTWRWHRGANGDTDSVSAPFKDFGRCVSDAIKNGFRADLHPYSTRAHGLISGTEIHWSRRSDDPR